MIDKQIASIKLLKLRQQEKLELELTKTKQHIVTVNNLIQSLEDQREDNQQHKSSYITSFYGNLRKITKFASNVFYELESEMAKFNITHNDIEQEIADKIEELETLQQQTEQLQQELKKIIVKLEKYQFISDSLII